MPRQRPLYRHLHFYKENEALIDFFGVQTTPSASGGPPAVAERPEDREDADVGPGTRLQLCAERLLDEVVGSFRESATASARRNDAVSISSLQPPEFPSGSCTFAVPRELIGDEHDEGAHLALQLDAGGVFCDELNAGAIHRDDGQWVDGSQDAVREGHPLDIDGCGPPGNLNRETEAGVRDDVRQLQFRPHRPGWGVDSATGQQEASDVSRKRGRYQITSFGGCPLDGGEELPPGARMVETTWSGGTSRRSRGDVEETPRRKDCIDGSQVGFGDLRDRSDFGRTPIDGEGGSLVASQMGWLQPRLGAMEDSRQVTCLHVLYMPCVVCSLFVPIA